jgi:type I restriction enzyme S subunit
MKKIREYKKLGELFDFKNGRSFKKAEWKQKGLPIIRIQNLNNWEADFNFFQGEYDRKIEVNKGDLLFSWSGTIGSSFGSHIWNGQKGVLNQHIFKITIKEAIDKRFAYYGLRYITEEVEKKVNGAVGLVHITKEKLNDFEIIVPQLPEQKKIVFILDKSFAAIDKAKANIEKNLQNTKELFESYLQNVFAEKGEDWEEKNIAEIAEFSQGIQIGLERHKTSPRNGYVRFIRIVDYTQNTEDVRYVPDPGKKYFVTEDDIVMVRYGTPGLIGRGKAGVIANNLFKINITSKDLINDYLSLYLMQSQIQKFLSSQGSATMPALNFGQLKEVIIHYPRSVKQQQLIINRVNSISVQTKKLETVYKQKLNNLEELKKTILQKAFSGQLSESGLAGLKDEQDVLIG